MRPDLVIHGGTILTQDPARPLATAVAVREGRIAAVGDEINDVAMIQAAGLGVAMGNAIPAVRNLAHRHTRSNREDGVAHAINNILSGEW